ncbi:MAG: D-2-hydroxyacid dehydrogenase [Oscillospiraceae bacterium]|nr:D-2-hydroxyacid dehydrogenase [Oscillospiraceae bacterium]
MELVILDGGMANPGDLSWDAFSSHGTLRVFEDTVTDEDTIIERIGNAEAVFTNKTPITERIMQACRQIKYIGILATGYNIVDTDAAKRFGIPVCNVPSYGTDAVAQHTFALLLEICSRVGHHTNEVRSGRWARESWCFWDTPLTELAGKTIGIIGFGRIGRAVAAIAKAFSMRVLAYSRTPKSADGVEFVSLDSLFAESDVICLHCPLTEQTQHIICRDSIAKMKDGVIILNTGRGPLICENALADALRSGKVFAAGLDVLAAEPPAKDHPLTALENCFITPHLAWASKDSRIRLLDCAAENLRQYLAGTPTNVVNP